nr:MAG TPA: hypothetical protein [Caudoviricetes sp.]
MSVLHYPSQILTNRLLKISTPLLRHYKNSIKNMLMRLSVFVETALKILKALIFTTSILLMSL